MKKPGIRICIDRGGTFTDCIAFVPNSIRPDSHQEKDLDTEGFRPVVVKLLSVDPSNYPDAPREGIRRILEIATGKPHPRDKPLDTSCIELIRMGTTVATNALLERNGEACALVITKGFKDLLKIGNQSRPKIFDLSIVTPDVLYSKVVEVEERVTLVGYTASPEGMQLPTADKDIHCGVTGEQVRIITPLDLNHLKSQLEPIYHQGIRSIAVCCMHSFTFPEHEHKIRDLAIKMGFTHVTISSDVMPMIKMVPRGNSAMADAYLTPCIQRYLQGFFAGFDQGISHDVKKNTVKVEFMQSDGGLTPVDQFTGFKAILSGPAAGVVGYALTSFDSKEGSPIIGFDMGGTSTDVSRYAGRYEHVFETTTAGVTIQAPQLDINTVAAGGGSRLFFRNGMFVVGQVHQKITSSSSPESAGADPGPACYRKGGPLTITDANLFLGRLLPEYFPKIFGPSENEPLDYTSTKEAFLTLSQKINPFIAEEAVARGKKHSDMSLDEIAYGFVKVANEAMCRPIRELTQAKGHDTSSHVLACFGGAGGQHACAIARTLGIKKIFIHKYAAILSAYGLSLANVIHEVQEPSAALFHAETLPELQTRVDALKSKCLEALLSQGFSKSSVVLETYLNLRYHGTDTAIMTLQPVGTDDEWDFKSVFLVQYKQEFGFTLDGRDIIVDDIRIRGIGKTFDIRKPKVHEEYESLPRKRGVSSPVTTKSIYWGETANAGRKETPVFLLEKLVQGEEIPGPALIIDSTSTIVIEPDCTGLITSEHVVITIGTGRKIKLTTELDPIQLSIFAHRFMSIAEQMGRTLQKTSISTNIKERLDFSCALFGPESGLVANAPHIPVHLGSMQEAVKWQMNYLQDNIKDGDVILTNHPAAGGSHLPDITVITPVFIDKKIVFFVASRGHHADIGGIQPGSMPPNSRELYQEGAAIKSFKLVENAVFNEAGVVDLLLHQPAQYEGCSGTRCLKDNISDLKAQVAANHKGITLVKALIHEYGLDVVQAYMRYIQENADLLVRELLRDVASRLGDRLVAEEYMDDGTPIRLQVTIDKDKGTAVFDFEGTGLEVYGNINAPRSVCFSAIIYCLRCMVGQEMPLNQGALNPITIKIPHGSLLDPSDEAAVVGGNVMTSQRLCDVILKAFQACAASQGCCNNFTFGMGGKDEQGRTREGFGYYETIAGGSGAGGVHTHMTNTRITDPEILERRYPVILRQFALRPHSGGDGLYHGGDGVIREIEFLAHLHVSMLSERRVFAPYGLQGGKPGQPGKNTLVRIEKDQHGHIKERSLNFGGKNSTLVKPGDRIIIETPGGGGWGQPGRTTSPLKTSEVDIPYLIASGSLAQYKEAQLTC